MKCDTLVIDMEKHGVELIGVAPEGRGQITPLGSIDDCSIRDSISYRHPI